MCGPTAQPGRHLRLKWSTVPLSTTEAIQGPLGIYDRVQADFITLSFTTTFRHLSILMAESIKVVRSLKTVLPIMALMILMSSLTGI